MLRCHLDIDDGCGGLLSGIGWLLPWLRCSIPFGIPIRLCITRRLSLTNQVCTWVTIFGGTHHIWASLSVLKTASPGVVSGIFRTGGHGRCRYWVVTSDMYKRVASYENLMLCLSVPISSISTSMSSPSLRNTGGSRAYPTPATMLSTSVSSLLICDALTLRCPSHNHVTRFQRCPRREVRDNICNSVHHIVCPVFLEVLAIQPTLNLEICSIDEFWRHQDGSNRRKVVDAFPVAPLCPAVWEFLLRSPPCQVVSAGEAKLRAMRHVRDKP